jgi:hypothetical protein
MRCANFEVCPDCQRQLCTPASEPCEQMSGANFGDPAETCSGVGERRKRKSRDDRPGPSSGAGLTAQGRAQIIRDGERQHFPDVAPLRSEVILGSGETPQHGLGSAFDEAAVDEVFPRGALGWHEVMHARARPIRPVAARE